MDFALRDVQTAMGANAAMPLGGQVRGWSIDSRTVGDGDLFFAIPGERHDGHEFVRAALAKGAIGAVVSRAVENADGPLLCVPDTLKALQQLAHWARRRWGGQVVAITGSAGKTTTKDIIAAFLAERMHVGKTSGNFNNHLGVPLSLLRIPNDAEIGVIEIGMNHAGEIRHLAAIAEPRVGVVTNVGYAHVEAFESIDGIAAAKRELIESLPVSGVAVLNADDERVLAFRSAHKGRSITYGLSPGATIRGTELEMGPAGSAFTVRGARFQTRFTGRHAVLNILAGLAVASLFEIDSRELIQVVASLVPGKMRGERREWRGITILNDCYNSNPEAARSMIDALRNEPAKRRIAVLGEMLELGLWAERLHRGVGKYAAEAGVDVLVGVRGASRFMVDEAIKAGLSDRAAFFFEEPQAAGEFLREFACAGDAILFKGSRGTQIEIALGAMET